MSAPRIGGCPAKLANLATTGRLQRLGQRLAVLERHRLFVLGALDADVIEERAGALTAGESHGASHGTAPFELLPSGPVGQLAVG